MGKGKHEAWESSVTAGRYKRAAKPGSMLSYGDLNPGSPTSTLGETFLGLHFPSHKMG